MEMTKNGLVVALPDLCMFGALIFLSVAFIAFATIAILTAGSNPTAHRGRNHLDIHTFGKVWFMPRKYEASSHIHKESTVGPTLVDPCPAGAPALARHRPMGHRRGSDPRARGPH